MTHSENNDVNALIEKMVMQPSPFTIFSELVKEGKIKIKHKGTKPTSIVYYPDFKEIK